MLVLGIDPGLARTGYGLVVGDGYQLQAVVYGVIETPAKTPTAERLLQLHNELREVIARYTPDVAAIEELFFSNNARTAIVVGEGRGVALFTCAEAHLPIAEYTPLQVKQAITGYGQAAKSQVEQMVCMLLELKQAPRLDDAADALAIAICHHNSARMSSLLERQT